MNKMIVIAQNTFKENLRDKVLYNLVFFGLFLIGASVLLGSLTIGEQAKIVKDIGLAGINVFGVLIAIFVGVGLVSKEIEKRTIYTILAKPVPRYQFLIGRYLGLIITLLVNTAIMVVAFLGVLLLSSIVPDVGLVKAIGLIFMELLVIVAVGVMFSTFTTPTLSATFTIAIYVIGHLVNDIKDLADKVQDGLTPVILRGLYYALPNLDFFDVKGDAVYGVPIDTVYLVTVMGYGFAYTAVVIAIACAIFERRDF
jgi:ABC-type transport system involved in multi-copper enzyme maturation permease subunit